MSNYAIQRNMVTMTEHEFSRIMEDLKMAQTLAAQYVEDVPLSKAATDVIYAELHVRQKREKTDPEYQRRRQALKELAQLTAEYGGYDEEKLIVEQESRIKLLENTLRTTENELKQLRAKQAANELTEEAQKLGMYDMDHCARYNDPAG